MECCATKTTESACRCAGIHEQNNGLGFLKKAGNTRGGEPLASDAVVESSSVYEILCNAQQPKVNSLLQREYKPAPIGLVGVHHVCTLKLDDARVPTSDSSKKRGVSCPSYREGRKFAHKGTAGDDIAAKDGQQQPKSGTHLFGRDCHRHVTAGDPEKRR